MIHIKDLFKVGAFFHKEHVMVWRMLGSQIFNALHIFSSVMKNFTRVYGWISTNRACDVDGSILKGGIELKYPRAPHSNPIDV